MTALQDLLLDVVGQDTYNKLANTPQSTKWHAEGSVLNHTLLVMEEVAKHDFESSEDYQLMMASAIVHDLGKIDTTEIHQGGKITAYGHEEKSYKYIYELKDNLRFHFPDISWDLIWMVAAYHMRAHLYKSGRMSNLNKRALFEANPLFDQIMLFASFDAAGRINGQ